ncbi:MAG: hypothetical protein RI885_49 [Actinomycetota bacterium]
MTDRFGVTPIFTPDNEPYLGLPWVHELDLLISSTTVLSMEVGHWSRRNECSELQQAISELAPSVFSIAFSIRELVRQGYLLSGIILLRPLMERAATIAHLSQHEEDVEIWKSGWAWKERPKLSVRLRALATTPDGQVNEQFVDVFTRVTETYNGLVHGDPDAASFTHLETDQGIVALAAKDIGNSARAETLCFDTHLFLLLAVGRVSQHFPEASLAARKVRPYVPVTTEVWPS